MKSISEWRLRDASVKCDNSKCYARSFLVFYSWFNNEWIPVCTLTLECTQRYALNFSSCAFFLLVTILLLIVFRFHHDALAPSFSSCSQSLLGFQFLPLHRLNHNIPSTIFYLIQVRALIRGINQFDWCSRWLTVLLLLTAMVPIAPPFSPALFKTSSLGTLSGITTEIYSICVRK